MDPRGLKVDKCSKSVGISFNEDATTNTASYYAYSVANCHVDIDPNNPNWDAALATLKKCLGDCCIEYILFTSHGHPGGFGPINSKALEKKESSLCGFIENIKDLLCKENRGCRINACNVVQGENGKEFLCDFSNSLGTKVTGWDDWYAIVPHGKEYTSAPGEDCKETGDTHRKFSGSWLAWLSGRGKIPKPGDGKTNKNCGKKGKGGKQCGCKTNQKGCTGFKDGQPKVKH